MNPGGWARLPPLRASWPPSDPGRAAGPGPGRHAAPGPINVSENSGADDEFGAALPQQRQGARAARSHRDFVSRGPQRLLEADAAVWIGVNEQHHWHGISPSLTPSGGQGRLGDNWHDAAQE